LSDASSSHITRSTTTRSSGRRATASFAFVVGASHTAAIKRSITLGGLDNVNRRRAQRPPRRAIELQRDADRQAGRNRRGNERSPKCLHDGG
jgi:hypothetical protein